MPVNNIIKLPDGRYRYRYTDATGKSRELRSRKGEGRNAFAKRCGETEQLGATKLGSDITFGDLFKSWQEQYQEMNCSPADQRAISDAYRLHVKSKLGHRKVSEITKAEVLTLLTHLVKKGYSKSVISKARGVIGRPYGWAIGVLDMPLTNPLTGLRVTAQAKSTGHVRIISDQEFMTLLNTTKDTRYFNLYQLLWLTGLRPSEALGLQDKDIKGMSLQIRRGITRDGLSTLKTARAVRDIPITKQLQTVLESILGARESSRAGWLFPLTHGREPTWSALISSFMRTRARIGTEFSLYDFRHTFGTRMAEAGMSHKSLQIIMGHSDITVTMRYYVGSTPSAMTAARDIMSESFVPSLSRLGLADAPKIEPIQIKEAT